MRNPVRTPHRAGLLAILALACTAVEAKNPPPAPCIVTSVEATYPAIVQSGVPAQLQVTLYNGSDKVTCDTPIDIKTTDRGVGKATEILRRYDGILFEQELLHGPTQSITVKAGQASTAISGIQVRNDSRYVEPGITTVVEPKGKELVAIPISNTAIDDSALDGGISLGGRIYFFASNGKGGKLYSYDPVEGVKQRSNTNPSGPDHQWTGGFHAVNGAIYFNAFSDKGCVKIYRYTPGDPMVTKPVVDLNKDKCDPIPDQIATAPDIAYGSGQRGSLPFDSGHDTPAPRYFKPMAVGDRVYFTAYNGERYDVYEYDQKKSARAISSQLPPTNPGFLLLGVDANQLVFAGPLGIYRHTPGGPPVTAPTSTDPVPVNAELAAGIVLDNVHYFVSQGSLARWMLGDAAITLLSDTSGSSFDAVTDIGVVDGKVVFSALGPYPAWDRRIYAYTPGGAAPVTTPLVDACNSPCSEPAIPVGLIGGQFYFNGRDPSKGLRFYKTSWPASGNVAATPAFTVNTAPMSDVAPLATLGDAVYFIAYEGFTGYLHSAKFPSYGFSRGAGRVGFGRYQLFVLPAGKPTAQQVFNTVDLDSDGDDIPSGSKHPNRLTPVGNRMYFRARIDAVPLNPDPQYGLFSHAPGEGMATAKINADFQAANGEMLAIGNALYFIGDVGAPGDPKYKLFRHVAGSGPLQATDAISDLVPGGSDDISFLTDVGGVLFFKGRVDGNTKVYKWAPGDPAVLVAHNRTDIVPGGDDDPQWNPKERHGGDSSVIDGRLLFTAADGGAYRIDAGTPVPLGAADALAGVLGGGNRIVQYQSTYYRVPDTAAVVDGTVYPIASGGPGPTFIRQGYALGTSPPAAYLRINRTNPAQYVRACTLYGDPRFVANGVHYFWAYMPGTDFCTYMTTTPSHTTYGGYSVPFPALGVQQTAFGTTPPAHPWRYDAASGWLLMRGTLSPVREIATAKSFAYRNGELVLLSPTKVGNDNIPRVPQVGSKSLFVNGDNCGGVIDWQTSMIEVNCQRLYRYTP